MLKKRNKNDELILKEELEKVLRQVFSPTAVLDSEDYAYLLGRKYFAMHGQELRGDDVYEKDKKVARIKNLSYDGSEFKIDVRVIKPLHHIVVNVDLNKLGEDEDEDSDKK